MSFKCAYVVPNDKMFKERMIFYEFYILSTVSSAAVNAGVLLSFQGADFISFV